MLNLNAEMTKTEMFSLLGAIVSGICAIFSLIKFFMSLSETCPSYFYSYFTVVSVSLVVQFILGYLLPLADLYTMKTRKKYKRIQCLLFVPMLSFGFFSIIWWNRQDWNPMYCMFGSYLELPYIFGLFLQFIGFLYFFHFVSVVHAYTKRKFYLISIGGIANQEIRLRAQREHKLVRINLIQNNNRDYIVFEDQFEDLVELPEQIVHSLNDIQRQQGSQESKLDCPICLIPIDKGNNVSRGKNCVHYYHAKCIRGWLHEQRKSVCPVCRASFK